jgi:uncharacterized membrane protein
MLNADETDLSKPLNVRVELPMNAPVGDVRAVMFNSRRDPQWMAAVQSAEPDVDSLTAGTRVRRTGRFLGRTLRWTTEVVALTAHELHLRIIDGPMRGDVCYRIEPTGHGSLVSIRNTGEAPGMAPRWLLSLMMRRSLNADLRRLKQLVEQAG